MRYPFARFKAFGLVLTLLAVGLFVAASRADQYVVAYLPFGGGWSSRLLLVNPNDENIQVELRFFSSAGEDLQNDAGESERVISITPRGVEALSLEEGDPESTPKIVWALVESSGPLQISSSFDYSIPLVEGGAAVGPPPETPGKGPVGPPAEPPGKPPVIPPLGKPPGRPPVSAPGTSAQVSALVTSITGAIALPSSRGFLAPVTILKQKQFDAGLYFGNPNSETANISLTLTDSTGSQKILRVLQIGPKGQLGGMLTESQLFQSELEGEEHFDGTVTVCSDVPIGMLALGFAGKLAYALPVTPQAQCSGASGF